ncbi:hypothetical protein [Desulfovibrio sp. TomC]|uniref:hypothetical protein n=1 Tax=Desulfovibrio sp. TomC TaxID=1562888 RepID=UPI000575065C|nr:hypothetical protein [Desulfovibrio sp. TomC]KHK03929.1 hypothetical protein NY78_0371 [Desulfovibrio sp. TomC]
MQAAEKLPVEALLPVARQGYDIHRPFCVHIESQFPEVQAIADTLTDEIATVMQAKVERTKLKKHVRKIVLDLFMAFSGHPDQWIDYPRRKPQFNKGTAMSRMRLGRTPFLAVVDSLLALGYIEHLEGNRFLGLQSSMRATTALIEAIQSGHVEPRMVFLDHEPLYLKDSDGRYIDFKESRRITQMANRIVELNKLLLKHEVTLNLSETQRRQYISEVGRVPEMHRKTLYRVFNRGKFCFGGRFYGHAVQSIKSGYRKFVRIDGQPVCELDFGGMHIRLLYSKAGAIPAIGDVYDLGFDELSVVRFQKQWGMSLRRVLKKLLLIGINAKTDTATVSAALRELTESTDDPALARVDKNREREFKAVLGHLLKALKDRHPAIAHFIGKDQGIRLQRLDSDIADAILAVFVRQGRPIVPIHDSFVVRDQDRELLRQTMADAWKRFVPDVEPIIEDKF